MSVQSLETSGVPHVVEPQVIATSRQSVELTDAPNSTKLQELQEYAAYARSNIRLIVAGALERLNEESGFAVLGERVRTEIVTNALIDQLFGPEPTAEGES